MSPKRTNESLEEDFLDNEEDNEEGDGSEELELEDEEELNEFE